jgi:hypothetical protein
VTAAYRRIIFSVFDLQSRITICAVKPALSAIDTPGWWRSWLAHYSVLLLGVNGPGHFVPFGPCGSTVSGRHWYSGTIPFAASLASRVKALFTALVLAARHHRSASNVWRRCHSPRHTWLVASHVRAHKTHALSAMAEVTGARTQHNRAPTMRA